MEQGKLKELKSAFEAYMYHYFHKRDVKKTLNILSPNITGFGTNKDEYCYDESGRFHDLYKRDMTQAPNRVEVNYHKTEYFLLADTVGLVMAQIDIHTIIDDQPVNMPGLRMSAVFNKKNHWSLEHLHLSEPSEDLEHGESFPISDVEARNELLEKMVAEKTEQLFEKNRKLEAALADVKQLSGLLPICASCKKIRNDSGYWEQIESYLETHTNVMLSHGICSECAENLYGDEQWYKDAQVAKKKGSE